MITQHNKQYTCRNGYGFIIGNYILIKGTQCVLYYYKIVIRKICIIFIHEKNKQCMWTSERLTSFPTGFSFLFRRTFTGQRVTRPRSRGLLLVLPPVQHIRLLDQMEIYCDRSTWYDFYLNVIMIYLYVYFINSNGFNRSAWSEGPIPDLTILMLRKNFSKKKIPKLRFQTNNSKKLPPPTTTNVTTTYYCTIYIEIYDRTGPTSKTRSPGDPTEMDFQMHFCGVVGEKKREIHTRQASGTRARPVAVQGEYTTSSSHRPLHNTRVGDGRYAIDSAWSVPCVAYALLSTVPQPGDPGSHMQ